MRPTEEPDIDEMELDEVVIEDEQEKTHPRDADTPFDPWGDEEEASDRRRDPLRSPV